MEMGSVRVRCAVLAKKKKRKEKMNERACIKYFRASLSIDFFFFLARLVVACTTLATVRTWRRSVIS